MISYKKEFVEFITVLQNTICDALELADGKAKFKEELWQRPEGGGGKTRVIENGKVFEKGGVNISEVYGELPASMAAYLNAKHTQFFACGLSLVIHPNNPFVPTVHANYRYFELYDTDGTLVDQWFGGGADLTPYYLFEEDAMHFHAIHQKVCNQFHYDLYQTYKQACDEYFYNHHRKEARGIGGLFFDHLKNSPEASYTQFDFVTAVATQFLSAYLPIVQKRKALAYEPEHKFWQEIRRGRYVEFNLIHDKGTLFGLKTNGRIESILMSLPPTVRWEYCYEPLVNSPENQLLIVLKNPKNWI
jgi:coproporphyrinogen III oxidase